MNQAGPELTEKLKQIPEKPGIYRMRDQEGNILYIGKSKNLKPRIRSYFNRKHDWRKIEQMMFHLHDLDYIVTDTHLEAQLLECALIKKLKPMYNAQFKNDHRYQYLQLEVKPGGKPVTLTNERLHSDCFGPFRSKGLLQKGIEFLEGVYPIQKRGNTVDFSYHLLPGPLETACFQENRENLFRIFSESRWREAFLDEIANKMAESAQHLEFERAGIYRDMLEVFQYFHRTLGKQSFVLSNRPILLGIPIDGGYKLFYIQSAYLIYKRKYSAIPTESDIEYFIRQAAGVMDKRPLVMEEKSSLDFRQILEREVALLPAKMEIGPELKKEAVLHFLDKLEVKG